MGAPTSVRKQVTFSGQPVSIFTIPANSTIQVEPGAGGSMTCKVRVHPDSALIDLDPDTASFSASASRAILGPVYEIQFAALVADGFGSVAY